MLHPFPAVLFAFAVAALCGGARPAVAAPDCEALAARAGQEVGLPPGLLPAIARVESARGGRAWPWTLNQGGKGSYHASKDEALAQLAAILSEGVRNVDLGCMQLNWRWHSDAFPDASSMMDPDQNTRYAARYLRELHDRLGTWDLAVASYHSSNPERGSAYAAKVASAQAAIGQVAPSVGPVAMAAVPPAPPGRPPALMRGVLTVAGAPLIARQPGGGLFARGAPLIGMMP